MPRRAKRPRQGAAFPPAAPSSGSRPDVVVRAGTLDDPSAVSPDVHIFTRTKVPWLMVPELVPAFEVYYDSRTLWPPESLARLKAVMPER